LHPHLGVVSLGTARSFVIADIPGVVEGAAEGVGLGIQFLKHLSRTRLLLHLVDILPVEGDPVEDVEKIAHELQKYSDTLARRERWLVLNKMDLLAADEIDAHCQAIVEQLQWQGQVFQISAVTGQGCDAVCQAILSYLEQQDIQTQDS